MKTKMRVLLLATPMILLFALPPFARAFQETKATDQHPMLGVSVSELHPSLKAQLGKIIGKDRGVMIGEVAADSPAAKAGIKQYDIVTSIDGKDISSAGQLAKAVRNAKVDSEAVIELVRDGSPHKVTVKLAAMAESASRKFFPRFDSFRPSDRLTSAEQMLFDDASTLNTFEAMTIKKMPDNKFLARIEWMDKDDKKMEREFTGSYQEVRRAIRTDKELPTTQREHLLRSLRDQSAGSGLTEWLGNFGL
jgi:membrane-associated protease RseP (regulator of RpoE activity)